MVVAPQNFYILINMVREADLLARRVSHVRGDFARLKIEFRLRCFAEDVAIRVSSLSFLRGLLDQCRSLRIVLHPFRIQKIAQRIFWSEPHVQRTVVNLIIAGDMWQRFRRVHK